jgi:DeoR/GlpR family transcriptional regulator of sugar metabolism
MSTDLRRRSILSILTRDGEARISALAKSFRTSEMTIRRDLETLELEGLVRRVRGGAIPSINRSYEPPIALRYGEAHSAKERIGRAAADLLRDGETAIIDVGTTTLEMAKAISGRQALTVVTSSLQVAVELSKHPEIRTLVSGGLVRPGEMSLIGARAEDSYVDLNCDSVFLGVAGISAEKGLTEYNLDDTRVKQRAIQAAQRCIVLADATKLGRVAFATVASISQVDVLITDALPTDPIIRALEDADVEVIHVEPAIKIHSKEKR